MYMQCRQGGSEIPLDFRQNVPGAIVLTILMNPTTQLTQECEANVQLLEIDTAVLVHRRRVGFSRGWRLFHYWSSNLLPSLSMLVL